MLTPFLVKSRPSEDQAIVNAVAQGDKIIKLTITGDSAELLEAQKDRVSAWNDALIKSFPDLA